MMRVALRGAVLLVSAGVALSACSGSHGRTAASKVSKVTTTSTPPASTPPAQAGAPPSSMPAPSTTATVGRSPTVSSPAVTAPLLTNLPVADDCAGAPHTRPAQIVLACANAAVVADNIAWSSWTPGQATGSATMVVNDCTPDCADGHDHNYPASIVLGGVHVRGGRNIYTVATITYTGPTPPGQPRSDDYSIAPAG